MHLRILFDFVPTPIMLAAAATVLVLMLWTVRRGVVWGRPGAVLLGVLALAWIPVNRPVEGPILLRLADDMGVTLADLLTVAVGLLALLRFIRASSSEQVTTENSGARQRV